MGLLVCRKPLFFHGGDPVFRPYGDGSSADSHSVGAYHTAFGDH